MSGLNIKYLLKPGFDEGIANMLEKGKEATELSFHLPAVRKDGSEFATQFSFRFLPDFRFRWAVFVQAPADSNGGTDKPAMVPQAIVPTTETTTTETPEVATDEELPAPAVVLSRQLNAQRSPAQLEDSQNERNGLIQLKQDFSAEPEPAAAPKKAQDEFKDLRRRQALGSEATELRKERDELQGKLPSSEELNIELQKLQSAREQVEARLRESMARCSDWEKKVADLRKFVDELTRRHAAEQNAAVKAAQRIKDLEERLNRAGEGPAAGNKDTQGQDATLTEANAKARAELDKEREAIKVSRKKEELLQTQVQTLQGALEQAEACAHESAPQSKDWEQRAAGLKKCVDDLTRRHAAEQSAAVKAAQRIKELEEQLKRAGDDQADGKKNVEEATRQRPEAKNRNLTEASAKARAELDREREAIEVSQQKQEILQAQIQPLQGALQQAEARARENTPQSKEWEKRAVNLKKCVDELARKQAAEQNAAVKAAERVKKLEEQLKRPAENQAASKKNNEDQDATRQRLETENRNLTEANAKTRAELDEEREAIQVSRKKEEKLQTQVQMLQSALDEVEARARESATQSRDWEKKAADLKKSVDEFTSRHAAEQTATLKAAQRVAELEEQLKRADDDQAAGKKNIEDRDATRQRLETENRNLTEANAKARAELDKEREAIKDWRKKEEELQTKVKTLQGTLEQAEARARESAAQTRDWEKKAADLKKSVDEFTRRHADEENAAVKAAQRVAELEEQLKRAGDNQAAGKKNIENRDATRQRLEAENRDLAEAIDRARAELDKEREAFKVSRQKQEELQTQVQALQGAFEKAEARANESAVQSRDWQKKAADLKKSVDEFTRRHAAEQNAPVKAAQRVKELEEQLKRAADELAASKKNIDDQDPARQRLEAANRNLTKTNAKARADLDKERGVIKVLRKKEEDLQIQVEKLQGAFEKAEARARESAAQSKDWEKKAADLKKSVDELTGSHADEQSAAAKRVKELEKQLKRAGDDLAASKAEHRHMTESAEKHAALEKKVGELEQCTHQSLLSLAKANAELESQRAERERAEKSALAAAAQLEKLEEKLRRQVELERASQSKIEELAKTIQDRGDELARASATLLKQVNERQTPQKQPRPVSETGNRREPNLASFEVAKKAFEVSLNEMDERLQTIERLLAESNSGLEKESTEPRRTEGHPADARRQLEKLSAEIFANASRMFGNGLYSDCHELLKQLMGTLDENSSIFNNVWNLHTHTLTKLGRYDEAVMVAEQRIKDIEDHLGKEHPSLMCPLNNLAAILERTGFVFEAERARRRVKRIAEKFSCVDDLEFGKYLNNLSYSVIKTGRHEEVECHIRKSLGIIEEHYSPDRADSRNRRSGGTGDN